MSKKIYGVPVSTPLNPKKFGPGAVYVGTGEMPEGYTFQIDPEGEDPLSAYVKTVNGIAPDENGNVTVSCSGYTEEDKAELLEQAKASGAFDDVLYVHVNKTSDGTLTTQSTSEQIYNAYKNNKVVICRFGDMDGIFLLPLFVCANKDAAIFNALVGSQWVAFLISGDSVQDLSDSLSFVTDEELETAVNDALAEAKASGAFKGDKGDKGDPGEQGEPGKDGQPGADGKDGADGKPGADGKDGYTPVKGEDYFTEADKREIAEQASKMVDVPEVANAVLVTITPQDDGTYTADTSYATIVQHITQGRIVYAQFVGFLFPFASMLEEEEVGFGATVNGVSILVTIYANDSVALSTKELLSEDNKEELVDAVLAALPAAEGVSY